MIFLARHAEQAAVFILLVMLEGIFWTPTAYFAGPNVNLWARDPYSTTFFSSLIAFVAVVGVLRAGKVLPLLRLAWPILPLICLAYCSADWSLFPEVVLTHATKVAVTALFGIYLISRGDLADLVALLVKANLVAAAASFAVYLLAPEYAFSTTAQYAHAWRGAFVDKNGLGINAGLGIMFAVYAFSQRYGSRLLSGLAVPANLFLLIQSQSKTPIVLLFAALYVVMVAMALRRRSSLGVVVSFLLVLLGLAGVAIIASSFGEVLSVLGRDPTLTERTQIWKTVFPYFERRPWLGYGFGSFWIPQSLEANQVWTMLSWKAPSAHNLWLQLALDLGAIGSFLAAFAWLTAFSRGVRLVFMPAQTEVVFPLALLVAIFVENFTEYEFFVEGLLWTLFCALLVHLGRELLAVRTTRRSVMPLRPLADLHVPISA